FACGLPVVTTAVGGIPYMTTHAEDAMLAPDNDAEQLAQHMLSLLRDPVLSTRLIGNGRRRALEHSWEPIYSKLARLYHGEIPA
ncbi:MAG: glycosyltransferase family 4 protein, partial [Gammaproteobacteria bacterium]|nr:glycosyltransferase family 4 protein [Gammaproteobacteria bacterium]